MSVLIKGMKMPKSCSECRMLEGNRDDGLCHAAERWLDDEEYWRWFTYEEGDIDDSMPSNCPLIEPPSAEKKGKIIESEETNSGGLIRMVCSECGKVIYSTYGYRLSDLRFCPYCGVRMVDE